MFFALLIAYTALFLGLFFYGVFSFPIKHFLPIFRTQWTISAAAVRFLSLLVTVHCSSIILIISFSAKSTYTGNLNRSIGGTLVVFLVFTVVYSVFLEGVEPSSIRRIERLRYQTQVARVIYKQAQIAYDEERFEESWRLIDYYRSVDPGNKEAAELFGFVTKRLADKLDDSSGTGDSIDSTGRLTGQSPAELIIIANRYLEAEDALSAYYFARLAKEIALQNGEVWERADRISAIAATLIAELEETETERELANLYSTKQRGIEALSSSDPEQVIAGYYIFKMLSTIYPDDAEVVRYFGIASLAATEITFFLNDAQAIVPMPGYRNIVFINSRRDDPTHELVKLGKVVKLDTHVYVEDIEVLGVERTGDLLYHYRATFAELVGGVLLLRGIDRQNPSYATTPIFIVGEPSANSGAILALRPTLEQLQSLSTTTTDYGDRGFFELLELAEIFPDFGYNAAPVKASSLDRVTAPFTFFILSIFSVAIAIRLAPERGRPPLLTYLLLPAIPFVMYGLIELYQYGMTLFNASLALEVGFNVALLLVIAGQLLLLIIVIFFLAATHAKLSDEL